MSDKRRRVISLLILSMALLSTLQVLQGIEVKASPDDDWTSPPNIFNSNAVKALRYTYEELERSGFPPSCGTLCEACVLATCGSGSIEMPFLTRVALAFPWFDDFKEGGCAISSSLYYKDGSFYTEAYSKASSTCCSSLCCNKVTALSYIARVDPEWVRSYYLSRVSVLFPPGWGPSVQNGTPFLSRFIYHVPKVGPKEALYNTTHCFGNVCGPFKLVTTLNISAGSHCLAVNKLYYNEGGEWKFVGLGVSTDCGEETGHTIVSGWIYPINPSEIKHGWPFNPCSNTAVGGMCYVVDFYYYNVSSGRFLTQEEVKNFFGENGTTTRLALRLANCPLFNYGEYYERRRYWEDDPGDLFRMFYEGRFVYKESIDVPPLTSDTPLEVLLVDKATEWIGFWGGSVRAHVLEGADDTLYSTNGLLLTVAQLNTSSGYKRFVAYGPLIRPTIVDYEVQDITARRHRVRIRVDPHFFWNPEFTGARALIVKQFVKVRDLKDLFWHSDAGSVYRPVVTGYVELNRVSSGSESGELTFEGIVDVPPDSTGLLVVAYNVLYSDPLVIIDYPSTTPTFRPNIRVLDEETGSGIEGAHVILGSSSASYEGTTGGGGVWVAPQVSPGYYWVYAYKEGYLPNNATFLMDHPGTYTINLSRAKGLITVNVLESGTGSPIEGAYVSLLRKSDNLSMFDYTNENGTAIFPSDEGTWVIYAAKEGYHPSNTTILVTPDQLDRNVTLYLNKTGSGGGGEEGGGAPASEVSTKVILGGWISLELPGNLSGDYIVVSEYAKYWNGSSYGTGARMLYDEVENVTYLDTSGGKGLQFFPLEYLLSSPEEAFSLIGRNVTIELVRLDGYTVRVNAKVGTLKFGEVSVSGREVNGRLVWSDGTPFKPMGERDFVQIVVMETGDSTVVKPDGTFTLHLSRELSSFTLRIFFKAYGPSGSYQVPFSGSYVWKG